MHIVLTSLAVLCASACFSVAAFAQSPAAANPISAGVRTAWESGKRNVTRSAELMPEADYAFAVNTVRTFGEILAHVAGRITCSARRRRGRSRPTQKRRSRRPRRLARRSSRCSANRSPIAMRRLRGSTTNGPARRSSCRSGWGRVPGALPLMINSGHLQEHYGNLVTYFRIKGMVPPSSQGQ